MGYGTIPMLNTQGTMGINTPNAVGKEPTPISPMQEARNGLSNSVSFLHDRLGDLERRLDSVCRPTSPMTDQANGGGAQVPPSELRSFLIEHSNGVRNAIARIESLLERLEV